MTVTVDQPTIAWAHDTRTDQPLPGPAVTAWLASNGITTGRTVRIEIHADGLIYWWTLDRAADVCLRCGNTEAVYRNHLTGPHVTALIVPLPPVLAVLDGG